MTRLFRGAFIVWVVLRYGLDELVPYQFSETVVAIAGADCFSRTQLQRPEASVCARRWNGWGRFLSNSARYLSTRRDLMPLDIADELARCKTGAAFARSDRPCHPLKVRFAQALDDIFVSFEQVPVASASIAQVHFAVMKDRNPGASAMWPSRCCAPACCRPSRKT
jgi:ubiquinone biosynthesis protein